jgi:Protein of unknown function (DUF1553)/Protein of unknown function (DUF1549)
MQKYFARPDRLLVLTLLAITSASAFAATTDPYQVTAPATSTNRIDQLVFARMPSAPATTCSDAVFVRRVYLDVIGTLPGAEEAKEFIADPDPDKRAALIERLLARDEFADYWAMKWSDLLRVKAEFPINLWPNAAQSYHRWLRDAIRQNLPYNEFVRDQLVASGSNFENPPVNFYRAMQNKTPVGITRTVALTFMGVRTENWPSNDEARLAQFFANVSYKTTAEWKEEIVFFNPASTNTGALNGAPQTTAFPDGTTVTLKPDRDPRVVFADWLVADQNPWFARNIANRTWSWLMGRGIIEEPDDIRPDNPPSNPELLAWLQQELVASHYDLKHLFRLILNSRAYQLPAVATDDPGHFAGYPMRRLDAEVLIDAIDQVTGSAESYSSAIPEPYTFIPDNLRSIALPDGSISSAFLETFGRSPRDTGREAERNNRITAAQKLWLLNSTQVQRKIDRSPLLDGAVKGNKPPADVISDLYLRILSRFPTAEETQIARDYLKRPGITRRQALTDLTWALLNTSEFLYRH